MKKVILCAAALMIGGFAMAQSGTAAKLPGQVGPAAAAISPDASSLTSAAGANMGHSVQTGNNNKVLVGQAGTEQSVWTVQGDGSGSGDNQIRIMQTGMVNGNNPGNSGFQNIVEARQMGTDNSSDIIQEGDSNNALTLQGQANTASSGNKSFVQQGTGQNAEFNFAYVEQDGEDNESFTEQTYDNNGASTIQNGERNKASIDQNAGPDKTVGHSADVEQYGNDNKGKIVQTGPSTNIATLDQNGNNNQSTQNQTSSNPANEGYVEQEGDYNMASQTQGAAGDNLARIDQGSGNLTAAGMAVTGGSFADIDEINSPLNGPNEDSFDALAIQEQSGNGNDAYIGQYGNDLDALGSPSNYAKQTQTGNDNTAYIRQNRWGTDTATSGGENMGVQLQEGSDGSAGLVQLGQDNKAYQRQFAGSIGDEVLSTQRGTGNILYTQQSGGGNIAHTAQRGTMNQTFIVQDGGQTYVSDQVLNENWGETGNSIEVYQMGPAGTIPGPNYTPGDPNGTYLIDCIPGQDGFQLDITPLNGLDLNAPCDGC